MRTHLGVVVHRLVGSNAATIYRTSACEAPSFIINAPKCHRLWAWVIGEYTRYLSETTLPPHLSLHLRVLRREIKGPSIPL